MKRAFYFILIVLWSIPESVYIILTGEVSSIGETLIEKAFS